MKTIAENSAIDKSKVRHYAYYNDDYGIARLVGGGYYFTPEVGESRLVSYRDPALMLLGHVSTADAQWAADQTHGGLVARCSQTVRS
jgi:hypothetical protein